MMLLIRRRLAVAPLVAVTVGLLFGSVAHAQKKEEKKKEVKLSQQQQQEVQALAALVDTAMAGTPGPSDIPLTWHNDFLKALEGKTYVPFILTGDATLGSTPTAMYLRVTPKGATAPVKREDNDNKDKKGASAYPFEDANFIDAKAPATDEPGRISRAFAVPAGDYDVYLAVRERPSGKAGGNTPARTTVLKQSVTVPEFWNSELTTSSIILADRVEPLKEPLSADQQAERPYALGATEIVPSLDSSFSKKDEISVLFLIYNPGLGADKLPDLNIDYTFHTKAADGEKYFNKTSPQTFNAQSLPPQFDLAAGHQLVAGQAVPLAMFPEGEYRLEIKVTDKVTGKSVTRNINFTVAS